MIIRRFLIIILFISLTLSLGYSFFYRIAPVVDAQAYDRIAVNLVGGYGFREDNTKSYEFDTSILRAGPGYEFFLAGIYKVFGHHYEAVWIFQAILHAISAYLLFLICRLVFQKNKHRNLIGILAAALFGLHPDLIEISAMLMTETFYLFFVILSLYFFVKAYYSPQSYFLAATLGVITGVAVLTRPPLLLFIPIFIFFYWRAGNFRQLSVFLFSTFIALMPWSIRNYLIYDQLILTTLIGEYNLWIGNILSANGGQIVGGHNPLTEYTAIEGFFELKEKAKIEFFYFIFQYPLVFFKLCFIRFIRYFSLIRPMGFWFYQTGISQAVFVFSSLLAIALLFISGFSGIILFLKEKKKTIFYYFMVLTLTAPLVLIPTVVQSRYRFQIYPFLAIFGAYFLVELFKKRHGSKQIFIITASSLLILTIIDIIMFWTVIQERLLYFLG